MKISLQRQKELAYEKGYQAYLHDIPENKDPYQFFSGSQGGILLSVWWSKGYIEAREASKNTLDII